MHCQSLCMTSTPSLKIIFNFKIYISSFRIERLQPKWPLEVQESNPRRVHALQSGKLQRRRSLRLAPEESRSGRVPPTVSSPRKDIRQAGAGSSRTPRSKQPTPMLLSPCQLPPSGLCSSGRVSDSYRALQKVKVIRKDDPTFKSGAWWAWSHPDHFPTVDPHHVRLVHAAGGIKVIPNC